eukprot:SAG11_NODE_2772_length_2988_cov_3.337487_2_plen_101_part_00
MLCVHETFASMPESVGFYRIVWEGMAISTQCQRRSSNRSVGWLDHDHDRVIYTLGQAVSLVLSITYYGRTYTAVVGRSILNLDLNVVAIYRCFVLAFTLF